MLRSQQEVFVSCLPSSVVSVRQVKATEEVTGTVEWDSHVFTHIKTTQCQATSRFHLIDCDHVGSHTTFDVRKIHYQIEWKNQNRFSTNERLVRHFR